MSGRANRSLARRPRPSARPTGRACSSAARPRPATHGPRCWWSTASASARAGTERTGGLLAGSGIEVSAFDLRGHGGSGGRRGDVERWTDLLDDLAMILAGVRSGAAGRPVVLLGHSMGGLLCADYVLAHRPTPDLLVLSSPALDDGLPRWQHMAGPVLARVVPRLAFKNAWVRGPVA